MEETIAFLSPYLAKQARIHIASNDSKGSRPFHCRLKKNIIIISEDRILNTNRKA